MLLVDIRVGCKNDSTNWYNDERLAAFLYKQKLQIAVHGGGVITKRPGNDL